MKIIYIILTLSLILNSITACNGQRKTIVENVTITTTEDDPGPPPSSVIDSKLITLKQWFFKLCDEPKSAETNFSYKFDLWKTGNVYQIGLIDLKGLSKNMQQYYAAKNIKPYGKYYTIPKIDYKNPDRKQVLAKIKSQLKEYSHTKKFKQSFLSKADTITILFDDDDLVSLK